MKKIFFKLILKNKNNLSKNYKKILKKMHLISNKINNTLKNKFQILK